MRSTYQKYGTIVNVVLALAVLSIFASVVILFMPLGEVGVDLSTRATLSSAISTSFALVSGIIAIIIVTKVSSSDYKAEQDLKADTARLLASLRSIMTKGAVRSLKPPGAKKSPDFKQELKVVNDFLSSTTAFAYWSWEGYKSKGKEGQPEPWRHFFLYLIDILDSDDNYRKMMDCAVAIEELLTSLSKHDIRSIGRYISDIEEAVGDFKESRQHSILIKAITEIYNEHRGPKMNYRKFLHLKDKDIKDPNIDMFLALFKSDVSALEAALEAGADWSMTSTQLFDKYRNELEDFNPNN